MLISGLFLASSLTVIMTPGPDAALVTRLVVGANCRRPALLAAAGMITAGGLQATLSIVGVAVLLTADATLFRLVQWLGAALLAIWGLRALRSACWPARSAAAAHPSEPAVPRPPAERRATYAQGFLCTGTNPKVGLFLLAFLPQFVPPGQPAGRDLTVLAAVYLCLGATWLMLLTELVLRCSRLLGQRRPGGMPVLLRCIDAAMGVVFLGFAIRLALGG